MSHDQLEADLRAALRSEADSVISPQDPWQRNLRRVADDGRRRGRRVLGVAAAAVVGVVVIGALALGGGPGGGGSGAPAGGSEDPFASENIRGEPVEAETLLLGGQQTVHEIVLTDTTGDGPDLCDRYLPADTAGAGDAGSGRGGCTPRDERADSSAVAFDWLSGTKGSGDIHGVLAAVDARVAKVTIWTAHGAATTAQLHPTGWDDTKMLTLTAEGDAPAPQRLVAFSSAGKVLESVDLRDEFGEDWIPDSTCNVASTPPTLTQAGTTVAAGPGEAMLDQRGNSGDPRQLCLPLTATIQGATAGPGAVVLVVAPEVAQVSVESAGTTAPEVPRRLPGSVWSYVVVRAPEGPDFFEPSDEIVAYDAAGQALDSVLVAGLT